MKDKTQDQVNEVHIVQDFKEKEINKKKIKLVPTRAEIIQEIKALINLVFQIKKI
jgi:hypothetical protein